MILPVAVSVVGSAVVAWVVTHLALARARRGADAGRPPAVQCTVCETAFETRQEGRDHARDAHNAPGDPTAVDEVLELVER